MHVLLLPSWYPTPADPVNGVFFRDQIEALRSHSDLRIGVLAPLVKPWARCGAVAADPRDIQGVVTMRAATRAWLPGCVPQWNAAAWRRTATRLLHGYVERHGWPDLVHAHAAVYAGWTARCWKKQFGLPYLITEHSTAYARRALHTWQSLLAAKAFSAAAERIAVSPALAAHLAAEFGGDWRVLPNPVAARFDRPAIARYRPGEPFRFVHLAALTQKKRQQDLIDAFARVAVQTRVPIELEIGGDGPMSAELKSHASRTAAAHQITFTGRIDPAAVPRFMERGHCFMLTSAHETFGVVVAEALSCGLPVIATRCGGPEWLVGEDDGEVVSPGDVPGLAAAMERCLTMADSRDHGGIARRARLRFSGPTIAKTTLALYHRHRPHDPATSMQISHALSHV
ncbi:MAG: glycosyltransferase [Planctomycetota bacterium]